MSDKLLTPIEIGLTAAIVAIEGNEPLILTASGRDGDKLAGLPFGPFDAVSHRTFEPWYRFFPWEDWREKRPEIIERDIFPELNRWAEEGETPETTRALGRKDRVRLYFGTEGAHWDEERVLDRYELLYEAGLVEEARRDGRPAALARQSIPNLGASMRFDHRRILATGIARLRAKLKYRPVVFELLPPEFTLTELQRTVEAISGRHLHKQNFRRLVEAGALVEPT